MRIVIDLQSVQGISRDRGIGRYSLSVAQEFIRQAERHTTYLLLNGNLVENIKNLNKYFDNLMPKDRIKIFEAPKKISGQDYSTLWKIKVAEKIREQYISSLAPDITYITSIFEGWVEDASSSIGEFSNSSLTAATMYDLIPFIHYDSYLKNHPAQSFFFRKMQYLKRSNLLITLSDSGTQEAIDHLIFPREKIVNCSVGLDSIFRKCTITDHEKIKITTAYSINRDFIFYVGGIDYRKNIVGLIEAFTLLPNRMKLQLVIIVTVNEEKVEHLRKLYQLRFNLNHDELILIGHVSDEILLVLYNTCSLFVFPSLHEGFGLPIIEAMACGAPTIASNLSSIPEAIGCKEALFNPKNPQAIANKIYEVLENQDFKNFLITHGEKQVRQFSWENTAKKTLNAFEELYSNGKKKKYWFNRRKRMAYVSPLPPEKTGIADYSALLIPELACFYDIILITEQNRVDDFWLKSNFQIHDVSWFHKNVSSFDVLFYQFGNSSYHYYMIDLLNSYPGIVLLHDFFISGLLDWAESYVPNNESIFNVNLYNSHGYPALIYQKKEHRINTHNKYPCNLSILKKSIGIIVHSNYSIDLAKKWYGSYAAKKFKKINQVAYNNLNISSRDKAIAKEKLGFNKNDFLLCAFGNLHPNKLNHRLISASLEILKKNENFYLIFIGEEPFPEYYKQLIKLIKVNNLNTKIHFKGYSENQQFKNFLLATDIAIQLREKTRGETSACLLKCLSYGIPTICNAHGSINDIPDTVVIKLQDKFEDFELFSAIDKLRCSNELRSELSRQAMLFIKTNCHPAMIGKKIYRVIEDFYKINNLGEDCLIENMLRYNTGQINQQDILEFSQILATNQLSYTYPQLFIDISDLINSSNKFGMPAHEEIIKAFVNTSLIKIRPEPIYFNLDKNNFFYAHNYISKLLDLGNLSDFKDLAINIHDTDIFIAVLTDLSSARFLYELSRKNIKIFLFLCEKIDPKKIDLLKFTDGIFCLNYNIFCDLNDFIRKSKFQIIKSLKLSVLKEKQIRDISKEIYEIIINNSWEIEINPNSVSVPEILSIHREILINKIKYNFEGDVKYLSGAPYNFDVITLSIFQSFCQKDSWVLDLGANIGLTAIALADICYEGRIAAVEPLSPTFYFLKKNIKNANKLNITLHQFAVGNKTGEINMQATSDFLAGAFIADQYQADKRHFTSNVQIRILDEVFEQFSFRKLDFIKMDLEGYELFALEGARKVLEKFQPNVFLEMNHWCLNVFHRISLPEFKERLCNIFPFVYAIEYPDFLDFTTDDNFYHIAHEHVTTTSKYFNLIAGFNQNQIINKLSIMKERINKLLIQCC